MEEEEERGVSIGEIFRIIFKRVWWVVGVTAAVMIIALCLVQFWYNPGKQYYSAKYEVRIPSDDKYPDGTELRIEDSVLLENLQDIKDEKYLPESERTGKFADLDIVKMVENDDITFAQTIDKMEDETYRYHNNVRISRKYFKNSEQAVAFVRAVVEFPVMKAQNIVDKLNYTEWLARFEKYLTYEEKIEALVDQKDYIVKTYTEIKDLYGGDYIPAGISGNKTVDDYLRDLTNVFDAREQEAVQNIVSANYYVYDTETYLANAQAKIDAYTIDIEKNNRIIADLQEARKNLMAAGSIQATEAYEERIAELTVENARKQNDIEETKKTRDRIAVYSDGDGKAAKADFDKRLNAICSALKESSETLRSVNIATYAEKSQTIYVNNRITTEGGLNIILAAVVGAVAGFLVVAVVILIIDYPKYKKAKLAAAAEENKEDEENGGSVEE